MGSSTLPASIFISLALFACATPSPSAPPSSPKTPAVESPYLPLDQMREGSIVHIPTGVEVDQSSLIDDLANARVIYVGEVHDNMEDHRVQLFVLKKLTERFPGGIAVGVEMFQRTAQKELDAWIRGERSEKEFQKMWYQNWGMDKRFYDELFSFIREKKISLIALNAPDDWVRTVSEKGMDGLAASGEEALPEIDRSDPYHRKALEAVFSGHGTGAEDFQAFYDTMLLWDETMADTIAHYLKSPAGRDKKIVVFAGGFHLSYGFGIPRRVFRRLPQPFRILMPHSKEPSPDALPHPEMSPTLDVESPDIPLYYADYVWAVPYKTLTRRGVRLGVQIKTDDRGVKIIGVIPDSVADVAGLKKGDIVTRFDGNSMVETFDLSYAVRQKNPGETGTLSFLRGEQTLEIEVTFTQGPYP